MGEIFKIFPVAAPVPAEFRKDFHAFVPVGDGVIVPVFGGVPGGCFSVDDKANVNGKAIVVHRLSAFGLGYAVAERFFGGFSLGIDAGSPECK